jgi:hypothetical protein
MEGLSFDCTSCGQRHTGFPAFVYPKPFSYFIASEEQQVASVLTADYCIIEDRFFLLRCVFQLPIIGHKTALEWGVWAALSRENFVRYMDRYDADDRSELAGMPCQLDCPLKGYPDTLDLRCILYPQNARQRPLLVLQDDQDHPLVHDQRHSVSKERAIELAILFMHPQGNT